MMLLALVIEHILVDNVPLPNLQSYRPGNSVQCPDEMQLQAPSPHDNKQAH